MLLCKGIHPSLLSFSLSLRILPCVYSQELSKERAKVKVDKDIEQSGTPQDIGLQEDERPQKKRKPTDSCIEALDN